MNQSKGVMDFGKEGWRWGGGVQRPFRALGKQNVYPLLSMFFQFIRGYREGKRSLTRWNYRFKVPQHHKRTSEGNKVHFSCDILSPRSGKQQSNVLLVDEVLRKAFSD